MQAHIGTSLFCLNCSNGIDWHYVNHQPAEGLIIETIVTDQDFQPTVLMVAAGKCIRIEMSNKL